MSASRWSIGALVLITGLLVSPVAAIPAAADESPVPQQVAEYFATGLVPRLTDLYGAAKVGPKSDVGAITRVSVWTDEFLAGGSSESPTRLTNDWVAAVSDAEKPIGVATVWINPATDKPELADFDLNAGHVSALAAAPKGSVLVYDQAHAAWFSLVGTVLTPLVPGTSGVTAVTTPELAQATLASAAPPAAESPGVNRGLVIAGIVLGVVVLLLGAFVLLPARRGTVAPTPEPDSEQAAPDAGNLHGDMRVP